MVQPVEIYELHIISLRSHQGTIACHQQYGTTEEHVNVTKALKCLVKLRDEHVKNTQGASETQSWLNCLFSTSWRATLIQQGLVIALIIIMLIIL